jgi:hypothetical protein
MSDDTLPLFGEDYVARARSTDRTTSHEAAASVKDIPARQAAVLDCLRTYEGVAVADVEWIPRYKRDLTHGWPKQSDSGLRSRRADLVRAGRVKEAGETKIGTRNHTLWLPVG